MQTWILFAIIIGALVVVGVGMLMFVLLRNVRTAQGPTMQGKYPQGHWMSIGMCIGIAIGAIPSLVAILFDDMSSWAGIAPAMGFVPDKANALREFIRVCKSGGYVGMNETTWLTAPVPREIVESLETAGFSGAKLVTLDEWRTILNASGLKDIVMKTYRTTARGDVIDRVRWFGITGMLRNIVHMRAFAAASPANSAALKHYMTLSRQIPKNFYDYYGYGIYVGRK